MAYELIRFTLADPLLENLKSLKTEDEQSIHITAKRLLCGVLKGEQSISLSIDTKSEELEELRERIEAIEKKLSESPVSHSTPNTQHPTPNGLPQSIALDSGDREKWVICLVEDGQPRQFWNGQAWTDQIGEANRYQSEITLKRTLEKLKTRKRERPDWEIRYNSIANLEKILGDKQ
jgi:hypothetical protein